MVRESVDSLPTMTVAIGRTFPWLKNPATGYSLAFDIVVKNSEHVFAVVEVDGRHHFKDVPYWGTKVEKCRSVDTLKMRMASANGIHCVRISQEDVWNNRMDWRQRLREALDEARGTQGAGKQWYIALDERVEGRIKLWPGTPTLVRDDSIMSLIFIAGFNANQRTRSTTSSDWMAIQRREETGFDTPFQ